MNSRNNINIMLTKQIYSSQIYTLETKNIKNVHKPIMSRHDHWEFIYLNSGSITVINGTKEFTLKQNEIYFSGPVERHGYISTNENELSTVISCEFSNNDSDIGKFRGYRALLSPVEKKFLYKLVTNKPSGDDTKPSSEMIPDSTKTNCPPNDQLLQSKLNLLLTSLLHRMSYHISEPLHDDTFALDNQEKGNESLTDYILSYLKSNIYNHISLDDIANKLNYSVSWIKTTFKRNMGVSIIEYFNEMKIDEAKKLLRRDIKIGDVAEMLDLYDQTYFNRLFKKHIGLTPSEYRKSFINENSKTLT